MKVYDIIVQEGIGGWLLGAGEKQAVRRFATAAEELAFQTAVDKLSNEMVRQLRRGEITDAIHIDKLWADNNLDLSGTKWASDKAWMNDMFSAAIKDANERMERLTANVGTTARGSSAAEASVKTAWPAFASGALFFINAVGLFLNVKDVLTDPKTGYFPVMQLLTEKASSGAISPELFEKSHEEQLRLAAGRLLWTAAPFTFGTIIRFASFMPAGLIIRIFSKRLYGWINKKIVDPIASKFEPGPKFWTTWINLIAYSQDVKDAITTIVLTEGIKDSAGKSPWLDLSAAAVVQTHKIIINGAGKIGGVAEKSLEMLLNEIEQTAGSTVPNALKSVGLSKTPPTRPNKPKPNTAQPVTSPPSQDTAPETSNSTGEFNPERWKKLPTGSYQNKDDGTMITSQEFARKSQ